MSDSTSSASPAGELARAGVVVFQVEYDDDYHRGFVTGELFFSEAEAEAKAEELNSTNGYGYEVRQITIR